MLDVMQPLLASGAAEASGAEDTGETFTSTSFPQSIASGDKQDEILKKKKVVPIVSIFGLCHCHITIVLLKHTPLQALCCGHESF
jgi:hypothetical protein